MNELLAMPREWLAATGEIGKFTGYIVRDVWGLCVFHFFGEALRQSGILIVGSTAVIWTLMFILGLQCGIEGAYFTAASGAPAYSGVFSAWCDLREITPYAFGYMLSAKVGTGIVAELGAMRISEEIDALEVMGINSMRAVRDAAVIFRQLYHDHEASSYTFAVASARSRRIGCRSRALTVNSTTGSGRDASRRPGSAGRKARWVEQGHQQMSRSATTYPEHGRRLPSRYPSSSGLNRLRPFLSVRPVPLHSRHTTHLADGGSSSRGHEVHTDPLQV